MSVIVDGKTPTLPGIVSCMRIHDADFDDSLKWENICEPLKLFSSLCYCLFCSVPSNKWQSWKNRILSVETVIFLRRISCHMSEYIHVSLSLSRSLCPSVKLQSKQCTSIVLLTKRMQKLEWKWHESNIIS